MFQEFHQSWMKKSISMKSFIRYPKKCIAFRQTIMCTKSEKSHKYNRNFSGAYPPGMQMNGQQQQQQQQMQYPTPPQGQRPTMPPQQPRTPSYQPPPGQQYPYPNQGPYPGQPYPPHMYQQRPPVSVTLREKEQWCQFPFEISILLVKIN